MKNNILFRGILPALITPLNDDATVKAQAVKPIVDWMIRCGVNGFYVLGATGEGAVLAEKERMVMAEATADALKDTGKQMILHVGAADVKSAIRLAKHAADVGADAISTVYPNFFCRYSVDEALDYYRVLADASGLPLLGYCQALMQGTDVLSFVERLMQIDGVIGIKYTFPNYYHLQQLKLINGGNINVINGPDESLLCGLSMGADGGIGTSYNMMPHKYVKLYNAFLAGDIAAAQNVQAEVNRVINVMIHYGSIPAAKLAMEALGFEAGNAAFPARRYSREQRDEIIAAYKQAGLFD